MRAYWSHPYWAGGTGCVIDGVNKVRQVYCSSMRMRRDCKGHTSQLEHPVKVKCIPSKIVYKRHDIMDHVSSPLLC